MVPPTKISRESKHDALALFAEAATLEHTADVYKMSRRTLTRARRNQRVHGDIEAPKQKPGPKPKFNETMLQVRSRASVALILLDTCPLFV
jgi:uncharacterized protein (DUF2345 family)